MKIATSASIRRAWLYDGSCIDDHGELHYHFRNYYISRPQTKLELQHEAARRAPVYSAEFGWLYPYRRMTLLAGY